MKRNLFAIFLALALVVALAFVVAPTAQADAAVYKLVPPADPKVTVTVNYADVAGKVLDLNGNIVEINIPENGIVYVIDSAIKGADGAGAGSLKNTGAGKIAAEAEDANAKRFLKVPNGDGTYSFHPFYLTIKQTGVNTNKGALCLQIMLVTTNTAHAKIEAKSVIYGECADGQPWSSEALLMDEEGVFVAEDAGQRPIENGVMYAYYNLLGTLASDEKIAQVKSFRAFITVDGETVYSKHIETVSPSKVLTDLNTRHAEVTDEILRSKMVYMIAKNSVLEKYCGNFFSKGYKLVTDVADLNVNDQIIIVAKDDNYALSTTQNNNNRAQAAITKIGNMPRINENVQIITLKEGATSDTFALYTGSGYLYAASSSDNYLKTQSTNNENGSWNISISSTGVATVKATGTNTRNLLKYNKTSSLFSCYSSGQADIVIYKLALIPTCLEHKVSDPTCTAPGVCEICGKECTPVLEHSDKNPRDHKCDICGTVQGEHVNNGNGICNWCGGEFSADLEEITGTLSFANKAQRTEFTTSKQVWTQNGITLTNNKASSSSSVADYAKPARFYAGSNLIIEAPGQIVKIVFDCNSSTYATATKNSIGTVSGATVTVSSDKVTITFATAVDSFTIAKMSAQVRMDSIDVTYLG